MDQHRNRQQIVRLVVAMALLLGLMAQLPLPAGAGARNPCVEPGNLTYNCGFDVFVDRFEGEKRLQVPDGWWYFILDGSPDFRPADDTYWGAPSLVILSDGMSFTAGLYQQVPVTPGLVYQTDVGWAAARCNFQVCPNTMERRLGLDPTGGTDPRASSVVWSRVEAGGDSWPDLTVSARAQGPKMTVFVWVHHPSSSGLDEIYLDAVGLWPDLSQPAATATPQPSPTFTPKPPTRTPKPVLPTETPTEVPPTETPTEPPTAVLTDTPAPTEPPTWTPGPSPLPPTETPTSTPTLTPVPVAGPTLVSKVSTPAPLPAARVPWPVGLDRQPVTRGVRSEGSLFLYIALGALAGAVVLGGLVLWLWLRGRRKGQASPEIKQD